MNLPNSILVPIHRAGWPYIAGFALVSAGMFPFSAIFGWIGLVLTAWCTYFFRDPERVTPSREGLIVSPADGVVLPIAQAPIPPELDMGDGLRTRISIFMNIFDVHVNRSPCDGAVVNKAYTPGKFFNASLDKASEHNERMSLRICPAGLRGPGADDSGDVAVVQIAGLVARRIVSFVRTRDPVRAGDRIGLIRFGSRVDVYLPVGVNPMVAPGQRTMAGETVIADRYAQEPPREGEIR